MAIRQSRTWEELIRDFSTARREDAEGMLHRALEVGDLKLAVPFLLSVGDEIAQRETDSSIRQLARQILVRRALKKLDPSSLNYPVFMFDGQPRNHFPLVTLVLAFFAKTRLHTPTVLRDQQEVEGFLARVLGIQFKFGGLVGGTKHYNWFHLLQALVNTNCYKTLRENSLFRGIPILYLDLRRQLHYTNLPAISRQEINDWLRVYPPKSSLILRYADYILIACGSALKGCGQEYRLAAETLLGLLAQEIHYFDDAVVTAHGGPPIDHSGKTVFPDTT